MKEQWSSILDRLRELLPEGTFKIYFESLRGDVVRLKSPAHGNEQGSLVAQPLSAQWEVRLSADNDFLVSRIRELFTHTVSEAARDVLGGPVKVTVRKSAARKETKLPEPAQGVPSVKTQPDPRAEKREERRQLDLPFIVAASRRTFSPAVFKTFKYSFDDFVVGPCNKL
ncbi:MAG: hypothetical protein MJ061_06385, partial [Mailhella sp.]|nr:hypothetical protein [Mailhella sp.]